VIYRKVIKSLDDLRFVANYLAANASKFDNSTPKELIISEYKFKRTTQQNKALWGWYYKFLSDALEAGGLCVTDDDGCEYPYTQELLHEMFRNMYLVKQTITRQGKTRKLYWSTTKLNKSGEDPMKPTFSEYLDKIKNFARDYWQIDIPDPVSGYWAEIVKEYS